MAAKLQKLMLVRYIMRSVTLASFFCLAVSVAHADDVTGAADAFYGPNVYSPSVIFDYQESTFKMWYGGFQRNGQLNDEIYYRTASDGVSFSQSNYATVITPSWLTQRYQQLTQQHIDFSHTNDPSVTKHFNAASNSYQYTMFFTACLAPCDNGGYNSVWSVVSGDGINWDYPQPVNIQLPAGVTGPQNPSAIFDEIQSRWQLFFSVSTDIGANIYATYIDGSRQPTVQVSSVFSANEGIQNPQVAKLGTIWYLLYNTPNNQGGYDIKYAQSYSTNWTDSNTLLSSSGSIFCLFDTPSMLPISSTQYLLYFATVPTGSDGSCNFANNSAMTVRGLTR